MAHQQLCVLQLTCPLTTVVLRDEGREVARASLHVASDAAWTLEEEVHLFTRLPSITNRQVHTITPSAWAGQLEQTQAKTEALPLGGSAIASTP